MVAVLKKLAYLLLPLGCLLLMGCSHDDADAPVANPAGREPSVPAKGDHPAPKKLVPIGGMTPSTPPKS